ncbi:hypothetical protein COE56_22890 [Bacillus anthracis]|nr:hypothetical protein COE56_22890 [Bacillus anthracis]
MLQLGGVLQPCRLNHHIKIALYQLIERHFIVCYDLEEPRTQDLYFFKVEDLFAVLIFFL